jgi:hypothetical protein
MQLAPFWATFSQAHLVTVPLSHAAARSIVILAIFRIAPVRSSVARFFLVQLTKTGKSLTNDHKIYQMAMKHAKWL